MESVSGRSASKAVAILPCFSISRNVIDPGRNCGSLKAVKAVKFYYRPTPQTTELLLTFRMMVNHAIHICIEENVKGRLKLRDRIYKEFHERYGMVSCFPYSVAEVPWSIAKKHRRWQRRPFVSRTMLRMDVQNYSLNYSILSLPFRKGERLLIPLRYGDYQRSFLMDQSLKRGSITMTDSTICIAFSKQIESAPPVRRVGYDLNEKSIVGSDKIRIDLSEVALLHTEYGVRRRDFYSKHSNDRRLKQEVFGLSKRKGPGQANPPQSRKADCKQGEGEQGGDCP